jgi:hypothetical protein
MQAAINHNPKITASHGASRRDALDANQLVTGRNSSECEAPGEHFALGSLSEFCQPFWLND